MYTSVSTCCIGKCVIAAKGIADNIYKEGSMTEMINTYSTKLD